MLLNRSITGLMMGLGAYHLVTAYFGQPQAKFHRGLHLAAILVLSYAVAISGHRRHKADEGQGAWRHVAAQSIRWIMLLLVAWASGYILVDVTEFASRVAAPNTLDVLVGTILIGASLDAGRRHLGWPIVIVSASFIVYALYASYVPPPLRGSSSSWSQVVDVLVVQNHGLFGIPIGAMAGFIVHFMIFAALLQASGAEDFFIKFARATVGRKPGGVAKVSVVSSAMMGTISGSAMANVASTGAFTIPMMKRAGFRAEFAGAVEAVASSGGQLVPPIMGVAAFLMADILGVPYITVVTAATVPAALYFIALYVMVHLEGRRIEDAEPATRKLRLDDLNASDESAFRILLLGWPYLVPIFAIIVFLVRGLSVTRSAFWGVMLMGALCFTQSRFRRQPVLLLRAIAEGIRTAVPVAVATAVVGIIVGAVVLSDLGRRLGLIVRDISGSELILALLLLAVVSIVLGMAMPTVAVYITLAVTVVPAIVEMGVPPIAAHLFAFYFGIIANITPPVAVAAFVAAGIADSNPMKTGVMAFRLGIVAYLVPFAFVYHPILVMPQLSVQFVLATTTAIAASVLLAVVVIGWAWRPLPWVSRLIAGAAAITLLVPGAVSDFVGVALTVAFVVVARTLSGDAESEEDQTKRGPVSEEPMSSHPGLESESER